MITYGKWSFTRSSNCNALTGKILVFWIGGRLWAVVAYERSRRTWRFNCSSNRGLVSHVYGLPSGLRLQMSVFRQREIVRIILMSDIRVKDLIEPRSSSSHQRSSRMLRLSIGELR